ncbi:MAG: hypothetical protein AAGC68_13115, partial [Verrucomicrobiota bacterium]
MIWFLLPWVELLTRIRQLRLPVHKTLENQPPPGTSRFPALLELTDEIEEENFDYVSDTGWDWDEMNQFYRLFYHEGTREQGAICLTEQEGISWAMLSVTTRHREGTTYRTTNLPFSNPMKSSPDVIDRRFPRAETFADLLESHREWMRELGHREEDFVAEDPEALPRLIETETGRQIKHNLEVGLIRLAEQAGTFRYSWRGLFYLYFQLVKDMVKMV